MKLTKKTLNRILENMRIEIPESRKKELIAEYGSTFLLDDGSLCEYTEQDILEQLRKKLALHNKIQIIGDDVMGKNIKNEIIKTESGERIMRDFLEYWGFEKMPFPKIISPEHAFYDVRLKNKLQKLKQVLVTGEIAIVSAEVGMGKSTFLDIFLNQVSTSRYRIIHLPIPQPKPRELYRSIAEGMGIDTSLMGADSMKVGNWLLYSFLESNRPNLLIIDEAHTLTPQSLNELRLLTNSSVKHQPILTLMLFGQPLLSSTLKSPSLIPFVQRVGAWISLDGLEMEQTSMYIDHQLSTVSKDNPDIFLESAKKSIHRKTQGIPRIINRICLECLHEAAIRNIKVVDEDLFIYICKNLDTNLSIM